jgi:hypothetical protein
MAEDRMTTALRRATDALSVPIRQFAEGIGVPQPVLSMWRTGSKRASVAQHWALARVLEEQLRYAEVQLLAYRQEIAALEEGRIVSEPEGAARAVQEELL